MLGACLMQMQALSKRIHYGKFVAEAKFLAQTQKYTELIKAQVSLGFLFPAHFDWSPTSSPLSSEQLHLQSAVASMSWVQPD